MVPAFPKKPHKYVGKPGRSIVWRAFVVDESDKSTSICEICNAKESRGPGDNPKSFSTSNMLRHLEYHHWERFVELQNEDSQQALDSSAKSCFVDTLTTPVIKQELKEHEVDNDQDDNHGEKNECRSPLNRRQRVVASRNGNEPTSP